MNATVEKKKLKGRELLKSVANFVELRALLRKAMKAQDGETSDMSAQKFLDLADPSQTLLWSNTTFLGLLVGTAGPDGERKNHLPDFLTLYVLAIGINRRLGTSYSGEDLWHMLIGETVDYPADAAPKSGGGKPARKSKSKVQEEKPYEWTDLLRRSLDTAEEEEESAVLAVCSEANISIERLNDLKIGQHPTYAEAVALSKVLPFIKVNAKGDAERVYGEQEVLVLAAPYAR